jgi:hypothetical protein
MIIITFTEEIIFNEEIENWPIVDALIIFYSDGFPYKKGQKYVHLRKPFLINDFDMQKVFWDRREVLKILKEENILTPKNIIIDRGDIIDNDGEMNIKLNDSVEIEKMIQSEKIHQESLLSNKNSLSSSLISDEEEEDEKNIFESIKIEEKNENLNNKKNNELNKENLNIENETIETNLNNPNDPLLEFDDHIEYYGKKLYKPFVEKPFNGDDKNTVKIKLEIKDNMMYIRPKVNGIEMRFLLDTGCHDIHLTPIEVLFMEHQGIFDSKKAIGTEKCIYADGQEHECAVYMLNSLELGGIKIDSIKFTTDPNGGSPKDVPLFGQKVLGMFGDIMINYGDSTLIIKKKNVK